MSDPFGNQMRQWRADRSLNQKEAAVLFGVVQQTIARWETSPMQYDAVRLRRIDEVYGLPPGTARAAWLTASETSETGGAVAPEVERLRGEVARLRQEFEDLRAGMQAGAKPAQGQSRRSRPRRPI